MSSYNNHINYSGQSLTKSVLTVFLTALFFLFNTQVQSQINYSENFESLDLFDPAALANEGWLVFGNVYLPDGVTFLYGYGAFAAPNGGNGFSNVGILDPGPNNGLQYINTFNDYNNNDHNNGFIIETNIFQERIIGPTDIGMNYTFSFDHRTAVIGPADPSNTNFKEALAYVRVVDPNSGFNQVYLNTFDTANDDDWVEGQILNGLIDPAWNGFILQFGFRNAATRFASTGVDYDNISFQVGTTTTTSIPTMSEWGLIILVILVLIIKTVDIKSRKHISDSILVN